MKRGNSNDILRKAKTRSQTETKEVPQNKELGDSSGLSGKKIVLGRKLSGTALDKDQGTSKSSSVLQKQVPSSHSAVGAATGITITTQPANEKVPQTKEKPETDVHEAVVADAIRELDSVFAEEEQQPIIIDKSRPETELQQKYNYLQQAEEYDDETVKVFYMQMHQLAGKLEDVATQNELLEFLEEHPELEKILQPKDIGLMVTALSRRYNIILTSKKANASKRAANKKVDQTFEAGLDDLEL